MIKLTIPKAKVAYLRGLNCECPCHNDILDPDTHCKDCVEKERVD